jgi:hypothetical protein
MEKNQNNINRNQDKTDNKLNQTTNPDRNKKEADPNNPVAGKDKKSGGVKVNEFKQSKAIPGQFQSKQRGGNKANIDEDDEGENDVNDGDNDDDDDEGEVILERESSSKVAGSKQNQPQSESSLVGK